MEHAYASRIRMFCSLRAVGKVVIWAASISVRTEYCKVIGEVVIILSQRAAGIQSGVDRSAFGKREKF